MGQGHRRSHRLRLEKDRDHGGELTGGDHPQRTLRQLGSPVPRGPPGGRRAALGCGLDSRFFRLDPGPGVEWYDVDYPEVAELRRQLYPDRDHYHIVSASVTDQAWLDDIPGDRRVLAIGEGLTMYLTKEAGTALLRRIVDHFPSGELQFDAFNRLGIKSQWTNTVVRRSGATLHWGIDGPDDIIEAVPGVRLLAWVSAIDSDAFDHVPWYYRATVKGMPLVPVLRYMAQYHRYAF
jgi:O-methyltransferase involved in polyketide biosynthesis